MGWILLRRYVRGYGLGSAGSGQDPDAGFCEHGNEPSGSIKCEEFLDQLSDYNLYRRVLLHGRGEEQVAGIKGLCKSRALRASIKSRRRLEVDSA
jgi:hypothetical protein